MLSAFQKKVASLAITCFSLCVIGAFVVTLFVLLEMFLAKFSAVIWPLAAALIASVILRPAVDFLSSRLKIGAGAACTLVFLLLAIAASAALIFALPVIAKQVAALAASLPDALQTLAQHLSEKYPEAKTAIQGRLADIQKYIVAQLSFSSVMATLGKVSSTAISATGGIFAICSFAAAFAVAPIYLYYLLTAKFDFFKGLQNNLNFLSGDIREDIVFFVRRFADVMTSFFRGQLLIALIMGTLIGSGMMFAGVKFGFLLGFAAGVLNVIPYFGTMIGLGSILPVAALQDGGGLWLAATALGIFIAVQALEGYVLTPRVMGDRTGLHPMVIIFSVFFWGIALNGMLGMILAIPLSAFAVVSWNRVLEKLRKAKP